MSDTIVLDGNCTLVNTMDGKCTLTNVLDGACTLTSQLDGSIMTVLFSSEFDYYKGEYAVKPRAETSVVLPTNGLMMSDDVTVQKIPYYETSNESGETIYIASEVN